MGIAAIKSTINCPLRYLIAMVFESVISSPVIKFAIDVLKLKIISAMNTMSINSLKATMFLSLNVDGSNAIARGVVKHTQKAKPMIKKSQNLRNDELNGMILVIDTPLVII